MIRAFIKQILQNHFLKNVFIVVITIPFLLNAQKNDTITNPLSEIIITGVISNKNVYASAENIHVLTKKDINTGNGLNYDVILNKVPGIFMQSGSLNTNRITIRGIGARSPFGTTSIRAYFGEIPLTDGNGNSAIEDLELASISSIEIHKGPAGSSFGVGLGGTLILKPDYGQLNSSQISSESTFGSYGLIRSLIKANINSDKTSAQLVYANTQSDGYRENNQYDRESLTATIALALSKRDSLQFLGNYSNLKAFIPSSVNLETYLNNPESAAFTWGNAQGFEDTQSILTGLSWSHHFTTHTQLHTSIFSSFKENYEPRPFNILSENTKAFGVRNRLTGTFFQKLKWGLGGELFYDKADINLFDNRYEDFPIGIGSVQGNQLSSFKEDRWYYNLFGEVSFSLNEKWNLNTGINVNKTAYKINDTFNIGIENNSGNYGFDFIVSPKFGMVYRLNKNVQFNASIAHGFAPPTTEETLLPEGSINPNLKPEKGWNFELGTRFSLAKNRIYGSFSIYNLKVSDLLVSRRAENESLFAINAGKTLHLGFEGDLNYKIINTSNLSLTSFLNYSIYQYYFEDFVDNDSDYSKNKLTGIPSGVFNSGISVTSKIGVYGNLTHQYVGRIPANDENSVYSDTYQLVNAKLGFQFTPYKKLNFKAFAGINNIFDIKYVSQLQVNASGFGGNTPRYYYAGNPVNYYGGISLSYSIK